jgi:hypothetical protein
VERTGHQRRGIRDHPTGPPFTKTLAVTMLGTWPLSVGATVYFIYGTVLIVAPLYGYWSGDPRISYAFALIAVLLAAASAGLGLAMLRARRGRTSWLVWMGGATGSFAGLCLAFVGWVSAAVILSPLLFGMLGLSRRKDDG